MSIQENVAKSFELQDRLNKVVNPDWITAGYPWYRAAWIEAAELMDHVGYKWWKNLHKDGDREQILLELVDIYHFMISDLIIHKVAPGAVTNSFDRVKSLKAKDKEHIFEEIEAFVAGCADSKMIIPIDFCRIVAVLDFTLEDILKWYLGKNALNIFRQDNGYKNGTYVKVWNGREDNEVLADYVHNSETVSYDAAYEFLDKEYSKIVQSNQ